MHVNESRLPTEFPFGRTLVTVAVGDLLAQGAEMIVLPANRRGVLGPLATPGLNGLRSLGGSEIEREAMARAPLDLGTAVMTGAAGLSELGVAAVIHAVVHPALGERARPEYVRRAIPAILGVASTAPHYTLALPLLGVDSAASADETQAAITTLVNELIAAMRRSYPRIDRITITCRFESQALLVRQALLQARERSWTRAT
jgi:O-acetyl-ADP-ribose deacetylase (regulator of RNase III)